MKPSIRLWATVVAAALILTVPLLSMGCGSKTSSPAAPTPTPTPAPTLAAPAAVSPVSAQQLDTLHPTLQIKNATATGIAGTVTYRFEWSEVDSFPADTHTGAHDGVAQDGSGTTSYVITDTLTPNITLFWRARATNGTLTSDWSKPESFKTQNKGFQSGQNVFDPLTDGTTVGTQRGGHFVLGPNGGWQSDSTDSGLDYLIPTCGSCRVEFDATNFGKKEGESFSKDLKWLTMGDAAAFGNFGAFRDHPWKMHLEQRADIDTALKLIWRNGDAGDGDPGDHTAKWDPGINWTGSQVYHFTFDWNPSGFTLAVNGDVIYQDGFGGHAYTPPNHTVSLGCWPRGETLVGTIWRNVSIRPR